MTNKLPFVRVEHVQAAEIIGARWWQEQVVAGADPVARRTALIGITALGVMLVGVGIVATAGGSSTTDVQTTTQEALQAQKQFGWNIGSGTTSLTFDGASTEPFDRTGLDRIVDELAPRQHGLVTRRQLLDRGASPSAIGRAVRAGRLPEVSFGQSLPTPCAAGCCPNPRGTKPALCEAEA